MALLKQYLVLMVVLLFCDVRSQDVQGCEVMNSDESGYVDVYCQCDQQPSQANNISSLTRDMSSCDGGNKIDISWSNFLSLLELRSLKIVGAEITFRNTAHQAVASNITRLEFLRCKFDSIPPRAFINLQSVFEITFIESNIGRVDEYAISNLPELHYLEFSNSSIGELSPHAISGLPELYQLEFFRCNISSVAQNGIHNLLAESAPVFKNCSEHNISENKTKSHFRSCAGEHEDPSQYGSRLLFCQNNITSIGSSAVSSNLFAFVTVKSNYIGCLGKEAFKVELSNQCGSSVLTIEGNEMEHVDAEALAFATSRLRAAHSTYLSMTMNTFGHVAEKGFLLHPSMDVTSITANKFICNCSTFDWIQTEEDSYQQNLQNNLVSSSQCINEKQNVINFIHKCSQAPPPEAAFVQSNGSRVKDSHDMMLVIIIVFVFAAF